MNNTAHMFGNKDVSQWTQVKSRWQQNFHKSAHISLSCSSLTLNTLRPRQHGHHFPDDIFKCIFVNENVWISIKFSLNIVPGGPINNIPALVQIMAWRRLGDSAHGHYPMPQDHQRGTVWLQIYMCPYQWFWNRFLESYDNIKIGTSWSRYFVETRWYQLHCITGSRFNSW